MPGGWACGTMWQRLRRDSIDDKKGCGMGYFFIIMLGFYAITAFLMWISGIFIGPLSPVREQVDIGVLAISALLTAAMSIYVRRKMVLEKQQSIEKKFGFSKIVRILGVVGAILITLAATGRAYKYLKSHVPHVNSSGVGADVKK